MHAADVKSVFRAYSIDVAAREKDDLKEDPIIVRLRKVNFVPNSRPSLSQDLTSYLGRRCKLRRGVITCHQGIYPSTALQPKYHHTSCLKTRPPYLGCASHLDRSSVVVIFLRFSIPSISRRIPNHSS